MQKKQRGRGKRSTKKASGLDRLRPEEAQTVLRRLLAAHRELRSEAQQIAKSLLGEVEFEGVTEEVEEALRDLGLDELGSRAGKHSCTYHALRSLRSLSHRLRFATPAGVTIHWPRTVPSVSTNSNRFARTTSNVSGSFPANPTLTSPPPRNDAATITTGSQS